MYKGYNPGDTKVPLQIAPSSMMTAQPDRSETALILAATREQGDHSGEKPRMGPEPKRKDFAEELPYKEAVAKYFKEWKAQVDQTVLERDVDGSDVAILIKAIKELNRQNPS
jgi:hypothetical protein